MINYSRRLIVCIIVVDNHCWPPSPDDQFWQNAEKHFHSKKQYFPSHDYAKTMLYCNNFSPSRCFIECATNGPNSIHQCNCNELEVFFSIMPLIDGDWCVVGSVALGGPCWWALGFSCYLRSSGGLVSIVPLYSPAAAAMCKSQYFNNQFIKQRMY